MSMCRSTLEDLLQNSNDNHLFDPAPFENPKTLFTYTVGAKSCSTNTFTKGFLPNWVIPTSDYSSSQGDSIVTCIVDTNWWGVSVHISRSRSNGSIPLFQTVGEGA